MDHGCRCHGQRGLINVNISNHGWWLGADTERYTPAVALCCVCLKFREENFLFSILAQYRGCRKICGKYHNNENDIIMIIMQDILLTAMH